MTEQKPTYEQLEARLAEAEGIIEALQTGQADAIVSQERVLVVRLKETEEALQESEERFRLVVENSRDGIHYLDLQTNRYVFMSPAQEQLTGFSLAELEGFTLEETLERLHPDDRESVQAYLAGIISGAEPAKPMEYRWRVKNGEYRWFSDSRKLVRDQDGQAVSLVGVSRDITDQKQAAESLHEKQAELEAVLQQLPVGVIIAEAPSGKLITGNKQVSQIWRHDFLPSESIDHYELYRGFHLDGDPYLPHEWPLARTIKSGELVQEEEIKFQRGDGSFGWMSTSSAPIYDSHTNMIAAVAVFQDITERKQAQTALRQLNETLEQQVAERTAQVRQQAKRLQSLSTRLANLQEQERELLSRELHDRIGQNLAALGFNLSFIRQQLSAASDEAADARLADCLHLVEETTDRIRELTAELRPPMLEIEGLAGSLEWYADLLTGRTGLEIRVEDHTEQRRLSPAVEIGLFRICQEALTNAARHAQANVVRVSLDQTGKRYRLVIADDGVGFAPAPPGRLPEGQIQLGLLSMRERAQAIGGRLRVESEPGRGTTVIVEVPDQ